MLLRDRDRCGAPDKRGYDSEQEALDALADIIRLSMIGQRRADYHGEVAVYECRCARWHLTSDPFDQDQIVQP